MNESSQDLSFKMNFRWISYIAQHRWSWNLVNIGSGTGLAPNNQQPITLTNSDLL